MGEMATSSHMQSINRLRLLRPARQEAELREGSRGHACFPGLGTGLLAGGGDSGGDFRGLVILE